MYKKSIFIFVIALIISINTQNADDDQVLIGVPEYPHKFYSGYLSISATTSRQIHYVFFQSQADISKDPLVIWLSGGPGCSSLLGAFHQNGPFIFKPGKHTFQLNKNSWNKNANMLYLQLPSGVGFSRKQNQTQIINDEITIQQAISALRQFYYLFPKLKKNDIYLTGHQYGAVFVANLAKEMIDQNNDPFSIFYDKWNIKGILVGNPCSKPDQCYAPGAQKYSKYHYQFLYKRAFFTKSMYENFLSECTFDYDSSFSCYRQRNKLDIFFNSTNTSQYNIYSKCYKGQNDSLSYINTGCQDQAGLMTYLNDRDVQQNWNIRFKQWTPCNTNIFNSYHTGNNSYHIYPFLIKNHLRIWIYSGDLDSKIPIISTKKWIKQLREQIELPINKNWRQWWVPGLHKGQDQVGGFIWELQGLTFVTVKGAGLITSFDKPNAMEEVFNGFINGKTLPYKSV